MTILAATSEFDGFTELPALSALIRYTDPAESGPNSRVGNAVVYPARARLAFSPTNGVWVHARVVPRASAVFHEGPSWILGLEDADGTVICGLWNPSGGAEAADAVWFRTHGGVEATFPVFGAAAFRSGASPVQRFDGRAGADLLGSPVEIGDALGAVRFFWDVNPATGLAWTASEIDATQFGLEALA